MNPSDWARFRDDLALQNNQDRCQIAQQRVYRDWCIHLLVIVQRYGKACTAKDGSALGIYQELVDHLECANAESHK